MLPDYPSIKKKANSLLMQYLKKEIRRHSPILKEIRQTTQHEGNEGTYEDVDGTQSPIDYKEIVARFSIPSSGWWSRLNGTCHPCPVGCFYPLCWQSR